MNVISLGFAAGKIADKFSKYPQYKIYKIDIDLEDGKNTKGLKKYLTAEEFEKNCPSMKKFLKGIKDEVLFICAGSGAVSGAALKILETVKHLKINVLYIRPDMTFLGDKAIIQERITFGVFQQYARSGLFQKLYLVDNSAIEQIIGDVPITQFYDKINELISSTLHMINVYKHNKPILENKIENPDFSRIGTFGITNIDTGVDNLFFPLEYISNKMYYYAYSKDSIEKDGKLLQNIKKQIKDRIGSSKISFGIYSTEYKDNFAYCEADTHIIQGEKFD